MYQEFIGCTYCNRIKDPTGANTVKIKVQIYSDICTVGNLFAVFVQYKTCLLDRSARPSKTFTLSLFR